MTNEISQLNAQVLAFIGDSVYTLYVREKMLNLPKNKSNVLHSHANQYVSAVGQSISIEKILPLLNDEEVAVFKRARNYKTASTAKHSTISEYRRATGFEAVIGYLYLTKQTDRLNEIMKKSMEAVDESRG